MVEKTIGNKKGDSVTVNYTLADSCDDTTVVGATSSVSWLSATVSTPSNHAGTITITATVDGSNVTRYAFITPSINGEPCDNNRIKVTQSEGSQPEPEGCDYIIVDGSREYNPDDDKWSDSSRITNEGRFTAELYDAIPVGTIKNVGELRDKDKFEAAKAAAGKPMEKLPNSTGREGTIKNGDETVSVTISITPRDADYWDNNPCLAAVLQWRGKGMPEAETPECYDKECYWRCWEESNPCPDICEDQPFDRDDPYLGTTYYTVSHNDTDKDRMVIIYWYPEGGEEQYRQCESRMNIIYQSPGGSGGDGPTITIDGTDYTGDGNTIEYSACEGSSITFSISESVSFTITPTDDGVKIDGNTSGNLSNGNHTITYEGVSDGQTKETTIKFENDDDETTTIKLKRKCDSQCTNPCSDLTFVSPSDGKISADVGGGTYELKYKCCQQLYPAKGVGDWYTMNPVTYDSSTKTGKIIFSVAGNTQGERSSNIILWPNSEHTVTPCAQKIITLKQAGGQQSEWTFTVEVKNTTASQTIYVSGVEIATAGTTLIYNQSGRTQLVPGASTTLNNLRFTGTAGIGDAITDVALMLSCTNSSGETPRSIQCRLVGTSTTIQDGAHYRIDYETGLVCS